MIALLEWAIVVTGVAVFVLGFWCACHARRELHALRVKKQNGAMLAAARHHWWRSLVRMAAGMMSMACGVWLLFLPDFALPAGVIAGCCWLSYQVALLTNLVIELWAWEKVVGAREGQVCFCQRVCRFAVAVVRSCAFGGTK
jgi:hypothetical protein